MVNINKIRELAKNKGIKLSFLAGSLGLGRSYFIDVQKSGRDIPSDRLAKIASLLHTTPEYLRDETDDPAPEQKEKPLKSKRFWIFGGGGGGV